jgi:hypothetical protein
MPSVFWDRKGILLIDFLPHGETINTDAYCATLKRLSKVLSKTADRTYSLVQRLLHDNAWPHTAEKMTKLLEKSGWENPDHPPFSPDLMSSDFHLFQKLKSFWVTNRRQLMKKWKKQLWISYMDWRLTSMTRVSSSLYVWINAWITMGTMKKNKHMYLVVTLNYLDEWSFLLFITKWFLL